MTQDYTTKDYSVYINGIYFDTLWNSTVYNDRPEPSRRHEKSLWTIFQLMKIGAHEIIIVDPDKQTELKTRNMEELLLWFRLKYPEFIDQLYNSIYTKHPHPADLLINN